MNLIVQSKNITNITQIFVFCAVFLCLFQMCFQYLKRYSSRSQSIPVNLHANAVIKLLSTFHATVATLLSILILYFDNELSEHKLIYNSFMISFTLNFSIGFLAYDFLIMLMHRSEFEWSYVVHHCVSITSFYVCSTRGVFPYIALLRLTSEGSTPFVNIRWLLLTLNKKTSKLYLYNGILLVIAFALVRIVTIVPNWYVFFSLIHTPEFHSIELKHKMVCVLSCIPLDILNLVWFNKIIKIAVKSFLPQKQSSSNNGETIVPNRKLENGHGMEKSAQDDNKKSYLKNASE